MSEQAQKERKLLAIYLISFVISIAIVLLTVFVSTKCFGKEARHILSVGIYAYCKHHIPRMIL